MRQIIVLAALVVAICTQALAVSPVRGKYANSRLGYEVKLPSGVVCMRSEPDQGCGFNIALRFTESDWKTDSLPPRYIWVGGELNTGDENTLERAVEKTTRQDTSGRVDTMELGRRYMMIGGLPACEIDFSYSGEENEALGKVVIIYRERKAGPNVIYTFGLHTPRMNEDGDVRLFHEFVSGFRVR
jgi:hypothetical protein